MRTVLLTSACSLALGLTTAPRAQAPAATAVTFTRDVAPILQKACQNCHRTGSIATMSLLSDEDARPWAPSIRDRVERHQMPPWHVNKTVGIRKFKDDPSLNDQEIATITAWVDGGAPRGNPSDMPPARVFDDSARWHIGKPELVVSIPKEYG